MIAGHVPQCEGGETFCDKTALCEIFVRNLK
jgi:hypothetical protein